MNKNSKTVLFKELLSSPKLEFAMEAHNGLSAKIVERAGFSAIWASGLSISASFGLRDNNEVSWTQLVDVIEHMSNVTSIPILVDGDTGHGNFNNVRLLIKKLIRIHAAAICIEDKIFPKMNSFINDSYQELINVEEFCGKIKAAKDSITDDNFQIIARVEALIVGAGISEALKRAEAYHRAGADAILIHSKKPDAAEILEFSAEWNNRCPLVIVPTKYYKTPTQEFMDANISLLIWANHNLRASIKAMEQVSKKIFREKSLVNVEDEVSTLENLFDMMDYHELKKSEEKYLPKSVGKKLLITKNEEGVDYAINDR